MKIPPIRSASVRVMKSFDYSHFEITLGTIGDKLTSKGVNELRKTAARLADKAVEQYKIAKAAASRLETMNLKWEHEQALQIPESNRTPEQKAIVKFKSDASFAAQFEYDYEDEWDQP